MVPPYSDRITRVPSYSISLLKRFRIRGYHPLRPAFPGPFHYHPDCLRAGPRSLAATRGISVDFFSSGYLDVSVPRVRLSKSMYSTKRYPAYTGWVSPFGNVRVKVCLPTHRTLSQVTTSFIASDCQGIHRARLVT